MSHSGNDLIYDTIYDEIVDGLDKLDDKMWEFFNDVSYVRQLKLLFVCEFDEFPCIFFRFCV